MTPNRLDAIAFRWLISAVFALCLLAPNAQAQSAATAINGVYNGTYTCAMGPRTLKLSLLASGNGSLTGVFTFYLPPTSHAQAFSYSLNGTLDAASGRFRLTPVKWETPPPAGYVMVGMDGAFDPGTGQVAGKVTNGNCGAFQAKRNQAETANNASVIAPQKAAGAAPAPTAPSTPTDDGKLQATNNQTLTHYYCVTSQISQPTVYFSESFDTTGADVGTVSRAYKTYLAQTYAVKSSVGIMCTSYGTLAAAEDARQKRLAQLTQGKQWTIDKTGWKYTAPPTAAATTASAPGSSVSVVQNSATPTANPTPPARPSPTAPASNATAAAAAADPYAALRAQVKGRDEEENRQRWAPPQQSPAAYTPQWMLQNKVVRGTVRRIEIDNSNFPRWVTIYFKESPDATFVVCSASPEIFQEQVGTDLSVLIGQTLEVAGSVSGAMCGHKVPKGSIQVYQSAQWQLLAPQKVAGAAPGQGAALAGGKTSADLPSGNVNLSVCNAGKVDVDVFVAKQGPVTSAHIAPAVCARVYAADAAAPAYVGLALVDSRAQWGTARRLDLLPDLGEDALGQDALSRAEKSVSVRHGNKDVSAQLQLLFRPRDRSCSSPAPTHYAQDHLPYNATGIQRNMAIEQDRTMDNSLGPPTCYDQHYVLNVVAYPDTREITFADKCTQCLSTEPPLSPAQKAAARQTIATLSGLSPAFAQMVNQGEQQVWDESQARPAVAQPMNWNELLEAAAKTPRSGGALPVPKNIQIRGTVLRVDTKSPASSKAGWVNIYFRESPDGILNVCSSTEIFQEIFGPDFRSSMVGKTLEVEGEVTRAYCDGEKGGIRIILAHQLHVVGAAR